MPLSQRFIWIATFQNLILGYKEPKEGFANSIRPFFSVTIFHQYSGQNLGR
jgi:hypothetical protein